MEQMNEAIRPRNAKTTVATVLLAVLVLMVVALASLMQPAETTGASNPAVHPGVHPGVHPAGAVGTGGAGFNDDPYINRHAEVVARYQQDGPRE